MGEMLAAHGLRSSASLPLLRQDRVVGVLSVFSGERAFFSDDLLRLLLLLADDLSFALDSFAGQATRERAEAALRDLNASLEQRVLERTRLLELANRELEAFSYSVSHDLRAPLRSIHGFAELLDEAAGADLDADARKYVERIKAGASRMALLIEQLLQLSRVSRAELNVVPVDLSELAREVVADLAESEPARKVEVSLATGLVAHADAGLARIVLNNLIGNAWKFTSKIDAARIELGVEQGPGGAPPTFYVRDNGAGFDPEHAHKLFAPFQRLHTEREFPGTGIGLALVQRIVLRHGGEVRAEGKVGDGATIRFSFGTRA
jgi:light-regulated signal transduction histidine kinase (bacteriophytochrome)